MERPRELLVLIHRDVVDARTNGCSPSFPRRLDRAEVVGRQPPVRFIAWRKAVQRVEADPQACRMGVPHCGTEPRVVVRRPGAGLGLPFWLDDGPWIVRPAAVVRPGQ